MLCGRARVVVKCAPRFALTLEDADRFEQDEAVHALQLCVRCVRATWCQHKPTHQCPALPRCCAGRPAAPPRQTGPGPRPMHAVWQPTRHRSSTAPSIVFGPGQAIAHGLWRCAGVVVASDDSVVLATVLHNVLEEEGLGFFGQAPWCSEVWVGGSMQRFSYG